MPTARFSPNDRPKIPPAIAPRSTKK
jgi:hypothetical protein